MSTRTNSGTWLAALSCAVASYGFVFELEASRLERDYEEGNPPSRHEVIRIARGLDSIAVLPLLRHALEDEDSATRLEAAEALIELGDEAVLEVVLPWLDSPSEVPRVVAAEAVTTFRVESARGRIERMVDDADPEVRAAAIVAIDALGAGREPLSRAIEDDDATIRRLAAAALARLESPDAEPLLVRAAHDVDAEVRRLSVEGVGRIEGADAITVGLAALEDPDAGVVAAALRLLGRSNDPSAATAIATRLDSSDEDVAVAAVFALAELDAASHARTLVERLSRPKLTASIELAMAALDANEAPSCVAATLGALDELDELRDRTTRDAASRILARCLAVAPVDAEVASQVLAAIERAPSADLADALAHLDDPNATRVATVLATGPDDAIALHALRALETRLASAPDGRVAEPLLDALDGASTPRAVALYGALAASGASRIASRLERSARDEEDEVLAARLLALGRLAPSRGLALAERSLTGASIVTSSAVRVLCTVGTRGTVERLLDRAGEPGRARSSALEALACGLLAENADFVAKRGAIVGALATALDARDGSVFASAVDALASIDPEALESKTFDLDARAALVHERLVLARANPCGDATPTVRRVVDAGLVGTRVVVRLASGRSAMVTIDTRARLPFSLGCAASIELDPRRPR